MTTKTAPDATEVLSAYEVARILRIGKNTVYELVHAGRLKGVWVGKHSVRIPRRALDAFLNDPNLTVG